MKNLFNSYKNDLPASMVVFLVALPLCLGIALASGAPLFSGIISGIVGGIVVGFFSDSRLSVSGPAAGLTVIVYTAIITLGSFETFLLAVVLSGIIQITLGYLKAGLIGHFFPSSVINGMLTAIGLSIILSQIPHAFGYDPSAIESSEYTARYGGQLGQELINTFSKISMGAVIISVVSLIILILWDSKRIKENTLLKLIPGPLLVVLWGVISNIYFKTNAPSLYLGSTHLVALPELSGIKSFFSELRFPSLSGLTNPQVYITAVTIAIVGSLESLLSLDAADKLDPEKRISSPNQELKAQGIGNIISGLIGGLPLTAVIVRSSANISAGAKSKLSAITHGLLLLVSVISIAPMLNLIPLAALAAILIQVGLKLNKAQVYKKFFNAGFDQFTPFILTIVVILATDLLKGITAGIIIGALFVLKSNFHSSIIVSQIDNKYLIKINRELHFFNKAQLRRALQHIPDDSQVLIDGTNSTFIDFDIVNTIKDFCETADNKNIQVSIKKSSTALIPFFREEKSA